MRIETFLAPQNVELTKLDVQYKITRHEQQRKIGPLMKKETEEQKQVQKGHRSQN